MGSDGFESKQFGRAAGGGSRTLSSDGFLTEGRSLEGRSIADGRSSALDPFADLGDPNKLVEVRGVIKWFDASKGYGFVVPDDGSADVLLHVTVLRATAINRLRGRPHRLRMRAAAEGLSGVPRRLDG